MKQRFNEIKNLFNENKPKNILSIFVILGLIALIAGSTFAFAQNSLVLNDDNTITSGAISMSFIESSNVITINNALPMSDDNGKVQTDYFDFSVTSNTKINKGTSIDLDYDIILEVLEIDTGYSALADSEIKVYLENRDTNSVLVSPTLISNLNDDNSNKVLYSTTHTHIGTKTVTTNYRLRAWIDFSVMANKFKNASYEYKFRININGDANNTEMVEVETENAATTIRNNNTIKTLATGFNTETIGQDTTKSGLYEFTETGSSETNYLFRGYVNNNWAKFGKETITECRYNGNLVYASNSSKITEDCTDQNICYVNDEYGERYYIGSSYGAASTCPGTWIENAHLVSTDVERDIYWKIYRLTGSDEVRMIYMGTTEPIESRQYSEQVEYLFANYPGIPYDATSQNKFSSSSDSAEYVGYMYTEGEAHGQSNSSFIKTRIDDWYEDNLEGDYDSYISTSKYCYDRTTYIGTINGTTYSGTGVGTNDTVFNTTNRLLTFGTNSVQAGGTGPSLICSNQYDNYELKIGLISADEANIAGLKFYTKSQTDPYNYLVLNLFDYWTGSPATYSVNNAEIFNISYTGNLYINLADSTTSVTLIRPVITLKSDVMVVEGTNGTWDNPYEFTLD